MSAGVPADPGALLAHIPVADLVLVVFLLGALLSVFRGLKAPRFRLVRLLPLTSAVVLGTAAVWACSHGRLETSAARFGVLAVVSMLLALHLVLDRRERGRVTGESAQVQDEPPGGGSPLRSPWRSHVLVALLLITVLLTWRLATFASSTLVWESPVTEGFGEAFYGDVTPVRYLIRNLVWNDGLVSNGQDCVLYGAPTYALMRAAGFSTLSLRIWATIAALALVAAIWVFAHRHFGPAIGAVAAVVAALNTYVVFYGKYGTSLSATLFICVVAAIAVGHMARSRNLEWWHGAVAGAALFLATLHYSPGRLVVLVLLISLAPSFLTACKRRLWRSLAAFACLAVMVAGVVVAQRALGGQRLFLHARGEQLFVILEHQDYIRDYLATDVPAFNTVKRWAVRSGLLPDTPNALHRSPDGKVTLDQVTAADRFEVVFKMLAVTVPQANRLFSPFEMIGPAEQSIFDDPPTIKPYFAPLAVFTLLGFAISLARFRRWEHAVLLGWFAVTVVPVLLTTRLDAHRIMLSVVPLVAWTAFGAVEAGRAMGRLGVSKRGRVALGWSLAALLLIGTASVVLRQAGDSGDQRRVFAVAKRLRGPLVVGALIDHTQRAWIELGLLERTRRDRAAEARMLEIGLREDLAHPEASWPADLLDRAQSVCARASLILAPADAYRVAVDRLRARGLRASMLREDGLLMWIIPMQTGRDGAATTSLPTIGWPEQHLVGAIQTGARGRSGPAGRS